MVDYELTMAVRLLLAAVLGGLVGLERESVNKAAGFRTHTLVCLGSCLIMITSIEMYTMHGVSADPARLAAQVVSGIGFLGAGTIMRSGFGIKGLTTAASLWVVAGIGLAVGAGRYTTSVVTTAIVFLVLVYMSRLENYVKSKKRNLKSIDALIEDRPGQLGRVSTALGEMDIHIRKVEIGDPSSNNRVRLTLVVNIPYNLVIKDVKERLSKVEGVYEVDIY
ncbi:MAG: MgtC/SapB family protein [Peptococcaceae bacterium]|jgi:putative Mg2+ transporter-C (MgtC) family protein|nr:MgtC/SapB family protein [Peptococcaceae bacterium]MDH7524079.1 MgtC/SapB family protein [Peptococcaceae bacterium]